MSSSGRTHHQQHQLVNVFKQFGVGQWKRCCKEGDVSPIMDRDVKATVYRISGAVVSANYIQIPKATSQCLGLTGHFFYLLFRPIPSKLFSVHLELATVSGLVVRISLSNIFREFKSTSTWLQFPFSLLQSSSSSEEHETRDPVTRERGTEGGKIGDFRGGVKPKKKASSIRRWILVVLDLRAMLNQHLNVEFAYLKNIQLCGNMLVKGVFTSHTEYSPIPGDHTHHHLKPLPQDMKLPLGKTREFCEVYDYVRYPPHCEGEDDNRLEEQEGGEGVEGRRDGGGEGGGGGREEGRRRDGGGGGGVENSEAMPSDTRKTSISSPVKPMTHYEKSMRGSGRRRKNFRPINGRRKLAGDGRNTEVKERGKSGKGGKQVVENDMHIYAESRAEINIVVDQETSTEEDSYITDQQEEEEEPSDLESNTNLPPSLKSLQPDPIMKLSTVIGFGGYSTSQLVFPCRDTVVYPCHNLVVIASLSSRGQQRFLVGHTDKVSCLASSGDGSVLASGQTGTCATVRFWNFETGTCLAIVRTHSHSLSYLSLSQSGALLCGIGRDTHNKTHIVLWNTSSSLTPQATPTLQVTTPTTAGVPVLTQAHTDVNISSMKIAHFDEKRMLSCGRDNVRFWRVKGGTLRSCPVSLAARYHRMQFTDAAFQPGYPNGSDIYNRHVYATTRSGHVLEIHYSSVLFKRVWHLLPGNGGVGVAITALCLHEAFVVTGSEDGVLRVWPTDFSSPYLEAEHETGVTAVRVSEDGVKIITTTAESNIGVLDAGNHNYTTLMRSHGESVGGACLDSQGHHLLTCSSDKSIRVWDISTGDQVFDFRSSSEVPLCLTHHPTRPVFACGFSSGAVRVFHTHTTTLLAEQCHHQGRVRSVLFSPSGHHLYSSSSAGSLAVLDSSHQSCPLLRMLGNTVASEEKEKKKEDEEEGERRELGQQSMALSEDGLRLAVVGPPPYIVSILDSSTLNQVFQLNVTSSLPPGTTSSAHLVMFTPKALDQLLVVTSSSESGPCLLRYSASSGQLLSKVMRVHRGPCTAISLSPTGSHLLTAGDQSVKVWDYNSMSSSHDLNFQVFVGHSDEVSTLLMVSDGRRVISTASSIFLWNFLSLSPSPRPPRPPLESSLLSMSPRADPPIPTDYEPLECHQFTPQTASRGCQISPRNTEEEEEEEEEERRWCGREGRRGGGGDDESEESNSDDKDESTTLIVNQVLDEEVCVEVCSSTSDQLSLSEQSHDQSHDLERRINASPPLAERHYVRPHPPHSSLADHLYVAPPHRVALKRRAVLGVSGRGRGNVVWQANTGLFVYSSGCIVVIEDLSNSTQTLLTGHSEEISTLAVTEDGRILASASHTHNSTPCEIRIWKLPKNKCSKVLKFHAHAVTSMAFSKDNRFLLSLGDYRDNSLGVWSTYDYSLVAGTSLSRPGHQLAWDPHTAYEFVSVGSTMSLCFWILEEKEEKETTSSHQLKVHEAEIPVDLMEGREKCEVDFTAVAYGVIKQLFVGSSFGVVSMWDTSQNTCLMFWKTADNEIGAMRYAGGKLAIGSVSGCLSMWGVWSGEKEAWSRKDGGGGGGAGPEEPPALSEESEIHLDSGGIFSLSFDNDMKLGVASSTSGCVWYVDMSERSKVKLVCGHTQEVVGVATSGELLVTACRDGSVAVWNVDSLEQTVVFHAPKKECLCIAISPAPDPPSPNQSGTLRVNEKGQPHRGDGSLTHHQHHLATAAAAAAVVVAGYSDGSIRIFSSSSSSSSSSSESGVCWSEKKVKPHETPVRKVVFSADGSVVMTGSEEGEVAVIRINSGKVLKTIQDHRGAPVTDLTVAIVPLKLSEVEGSDDVWMWACASGDRRVSVWSGDWDKDIICHLLDWLSFPAPATDPDGNRLRRGDKDQYRLLPPSLVRFNPIHPDTLVYTGYGQEKCIQFYSITQKMVVKKFSLSHWVTCMELSLPGHLIALGCQGRILKLLDYTKGSFQDYSDHSDSITSLAFSTNNNNHYLFSSSDTSTHIWSLHN